jgi:hypothetical protein
MSSKISQPGRGMPAATVTRPQAGAGKSRAAKRQQPGLDGHADDEHLFASDVKEEAPSRPGRSATGQKDSGSPAAHPTQGLARPQTGRGGAAGLAQAVMSRGQKPEYSHWDRLIAQASPERLAAGQAVLMQHAPALSAFAQAHPAMGKGYEP